MIHYFKLILTFALAISLRDLNNGNLDVVGWVEGGASKDVQIVYGTIDCFVGCVKPVVCAIDDY